MERQLQFPSTMLLESPVVRESALVVVEGRAVCPDWMDHLGPPPASGFGVVEQEEWEHLPEFLARLSEVLDRDAVDAGPSRTVVFVGGAWKGRTETAARRLLVLEILTHLARSGGGHLVLSHDHLRDPESCDELRVMVADLAEDWEDAGVAVSTRFDASLGARESSPPASSPTFARPLPSHVQHARPLSATHGFELDRAAS